MSLIVFRCVFIVVVCNVASLESIIHSHRIRTVVGYALLIHSGVRGIINTIVPFIDTDTQSGIVENFAQFGCKHRLVYNTGIEASHTRLYILTCIGHYIALNIALHIFVATAIIGVYNLHRCLIHHCAACMSIFTDKIPCQAVIPRILIHQYIFALSVFSIVVKGGLLDFSCSHIAIRDVGIDRKIACGA